MRLQHKVKFGAVKAVRIQGSGILKLRCPVCDDDPV